jgi:hypothetical protein
MKTSSSKSPRAKAHPLRKAIKKNKKGKFNGYQTMDDELLDNASYKSLSSSYSGFSNSVGRIDQKNSPQERFYSRVC